MDVKTIMVKTFIRFVIIWTAGLWPALWTAGFQPASTSGLKYIPMKTETGKSLDRSLRTTEFFTLAFGTMVGVGWLIVIDDWLTRGGPLGAMLGFLLGGIFLLPVAYVYAKFVRAIPNAGAEIAYVTTVFPRSVGFFSGWLMTLAYLIVCPWEAVAIGKLIGYLIPGIKSLQIYSVGGKPVFLPALILGLFTTLLIIVLNYRGIRVT